MKQIAILCSTVTPLESYLNNGKLNEIYIHPANFRVPIEWEEKGNTWDEWQRIVKKNKIMPVEKGLIIEDKRYLPMSKDSLFLEINDLRGLGLMLYGLLKCNFDLPSIWNGPGHANVLNMLPKILLNDMTCSSWTLGVLQSCLQPRVAENKFLNRKCRGTEKDISCALDIDTEFDPVEFASQTDVIKAINICQKNLERYQISTLNQNARQLTPVSIEELTSPHWNKVFQDNGD